MGHVDLWVYITVSLGIITFLFLYLIKEHSYINKIILQGISDQQRIARYSQVAVAGHLLARHLYAIRNKSGQGYAWVSFDGSIVDCNESFKQISKNYDVIGKTFQEITHEDDLELDLFLVNKLLKAEINEYEMFKRYKGSGKYKGQFAYIHLHVLVLRAIEEYKEVFIATIRPMTAREKKRFLRER